MRIVIVGAGEVGFSVAQNLSEDGHDIVLIEEDPDRAAKAENELDVMVIRGNGARPQVLDKAGLRPGSQTDMFIACSNRDEVNILASWVARKMGAVHIISRAIGLEFTDSAVWGDELGIDLMVSPERSVAREIEDLLEIKGAVHATEIGEERAALYVFRVKEDSPTCGMSLRTMREKNPALVTIMVYIERGERGFIPRGDDVLQAGDLCYSYCYRDQIQRISELYQSQKRKRLKRVVIVGAGKVGYQTARILQERVRGVDIRIIDQDQAKCRRIAGEMPKVMVLWGDGADDELLRQEGIDGADGFVASTDSDEVNLMLAVLAKSLGAQKSIAVVRRKTYLRLDDMLPIDAIVNRNQALSSVIISAVRHPGRDGMLTVLEQIGAETVGITISANSHAVGLPLMDLKLPDESIIGLVKRNKQILIPTGSFVLNAGDSVVVFASSEAIGRALEILGSA